MKYISHRYEFLLQYLLHYKVVVGIIIYIYGVWISSNQLTELVVLTLIIYLYLFTKNHKRYVTFLMLLFILGVIRTEIVNLNTFIDESHLTNAFYITAEVTKINYQGEKQQIYAKCEDIIAQNKIINCNSRISFLVRSDYENRLTIGDLLKIESMQKKIINSEHTYLIYLEAFSYSKVGVKKKSIVKKEIAKIREKILTLIFAHYGYKEGSILTGVLLGKVIKLDQDLEDQLIKSGTIHILVVSGYNVSIIIILVSGVLQRFSRFIRITVILFLVLTFCLLTGGDPPVVRATIMGLIPLFTVFFGRPTHATVNLLIASFIMLILSPEILYSLSFQLSFLATLGILLLSTPIQNKFKRIPNVVSINLSTTIAAQILVLPLLVSSFGTISTVSLITNVLILEAVPILMLTGALSLVLFGILSSVALNPFFLITNLLIEYIDVVTRFFANLKFSQIGIDKLPHFYSLFFYLLVCIGVLEISYKKRRVRQQILSIKS